MSVGWSAREGVSNRVDRGEQVPVDKDGQIASEAPDVGNGDGCVRSDLLFKYQVKFVDLGILCVFCKDHDIRRESRSRGCGKHIRVEWRPGGGVQLEL